MVERIHVALPDNSYHILVGEHLLAKAGEFIAPLLPGNRVIIISDTQVARFWMHRLSGSLEASNIECRSVVVPAGESSKNFAQFSEMLETLLSQVPDRTTTIIALGGGVVGDLAGFAASVLLRGIPYIQVPTTLLAQVDSSVGGKTGINSKYGKNLIGSFYQPLLVLADVATLSTLPKRELKAGYAEMLKYGLVGNRKFFEWLEKNAAALLNGDAELLTHGITESCKAKAAIVSQDEKEKGKRALLNFGHTFAHALELETGMNDTLLHGEAVAIGMMLAFQLSVKIKLCPEADLTRLIAHYQHTGLPASPRAVRRDWDIDRLMQHFTHDKKANAGQPSFILTRGIGKSFVENTPDMNAVRQILVESCTSV